jgi:TetR/AcrR family transcriptional regulator of autoinduction and epiphytic fitness
MGTRTIRAGETGGETDRPSAAEADGRRRRRDIGRTAVVDAVIDLILDGEGPPTAEQIAERAEVSVASVFRYFSSLDELRLLGVQRYFERIDHLLAIDAIGDGPLPRRIDAFVASRLEYYRLTEPMARVARHQAFVVDEMRASLRRVRATLADQVEQHFATELERLKPAARTDRLAVVAALTSFEAWDLMREQGLDRAAIRRAWRTHLAVILDA